MLTLCVRRSSRQQLMTRWRLTLALKRRRKRRTSLQITPNVAAGTCTPLSLLGSVMSRVLLRVRLTNYCLHSPLHCSPVSLVVSKRVLTLMLC